MWTLYLLYHTKANRSYLGVTTDTVRRLRQHRGEIVGGARFTARIQATFPDGEWRLAATLSPFPNQAEVTRWERLLKIKVRGFTPRKIAMQDIANLKYPRQFTSSMCHRYELPTVVFDSFL